MRGLGVAAHGREVVVFAVKLRLVLRPKLFEGKHGLARLRPAVVEVAAEELSLFAVPARADAEQKAAAAVHIQGGDGLGEDERVALGDERDARAELEGGGNAGRAGEGDVGVGEVGVGIGDDAVGRAGKRACGVDGHNGMLGVPDRLKAQLFGAPRGERGVNGVRRQRGRNANVCHGGCLLWG